MLQSPKQLPLDLSHSTIQSTPPPFSFTSQQIAPFVPSHCLGSTLTSEQVRENTFKPSPRTSQRLPHWMTQTFSQGELNLVNEPIEFSPDTILTQPKTPSFPLTSSVTGLAPSSTFPTIFQVK